MSFSSKGFSNKNGGSGGSGGGFDGDYNNLTNKPLIPTKTSQLTNDSDLTTNAKLTEHANNKTLHVTSAEKTTWNNKSNFSGNYVDLTNKPTIPTKTSQLTNDSSFAKTAELPKLSQYGMAKQLVPSGINTRLQFATVGYANAPLTNLGDGMFEASQDGYYRITSNVLITDIPTTKAVELLYVPYDSTGTQLVPRSCDYYTNYGASNSSARMHLSIVVRLVVGDRFGVVVTHNLGTDLSVTSSSRLELERITV